MDRCDLFECPFVLAHSFDPDFGSFIDELCDNNIRIFEFQFRTEPMAKMMAIRII